MTSRISSAFCAVFATQSAHLIVYNRPCQLTTKCLVVTTAHFRRSLSLCFHLRCYCRRIQYPRLWTMTIIKSRFRTTLTMESTTMRTTWSCIRHGARSTSTDTHPYLTPWYPWHLSHMCVTSSLHCASRCFRSETRTTIFDLATPTISHLVPRTAFSGLATRTLTSSQKTTLLVTERRRVAACGNLRQNLSTSSLALTIKLS
ncbi:hypothetical protein SPRG_22276 [Saprolegnia parasitica CBS 223.65]|uniref:Uncharacterized protein n=1 Tax=Saprolegnia parasitica (strain CBS 223.65) TaxID=695850 RepID=A0A067CB81_SAPPC|nr:hypothetical protein SPRG_22276 [Saprolegnia parasitica CBS 223.65]KDO23781.1 hypothetical protein SPRG_22276 [Saprolegnia parasitica CBS 223.65]|eukprot:XP_012205508.1 hypothetical protein SPRG_22276 [Saprolegnia parasitica CBS 223.65]